MTNTQGPDSSNIQEALLKATRTASECKADNPESALELLKLLRDLEDQVQKSPHGDKASILTLAAKITEHVTSKTDPKPETLLAWINTLVKHVRATLIATTAPATGSKADGMRVDTSNLDVARYRKWMADGTRFGEIMVRMAYLKTEDVERALELQRRKNCRLGEAMVDLGLLSRRGLEAALHLQKKKREPDAWSIGPRNEESPGFSSGSANA